MSITDKFLSFMKLNDEDDYDDYDEEDEYEVPKRQPKASKRYDDIDDYSKETVSRTAPRPKQVKPKVVPIRGKNGMEVCVIKLRNGNNDGKDAVLDCGQFELDSIDAQGPPATVTIKATSLAFSNTVRQTLKSKSWENITLSEIAGQIARQNGMGVLFESEFNPRYFRVEQYQTSDIAFLQKLCHNSGCS